MNNPFRTTRASLQALVANSARQFARENLRRALENYTREEIAEQLDTQDGPVVDVIRERSSNLAANTSHVEIITALGLSDFYWPHSATEIAFELRAGVYPNTITTCEALVASFENNTHVDCQIWGDNIDRSFQIKRYPLGRLGETNEAFLQWFEEAVIQHYGDMTGTFLAIILQPSGELRQVPLNPAELANSINTIADRVTFDEVVLTYNDRGQYFALHKLYPEHKRILVPLDWGLRRFRGEV